MSASDGGARAKTTVSYVALMCGHGLTATAAAATVRAGHCGDRSRLEAPTIAFLTPQRRLAYPLAPLTCTIRPLSFTAIDAICTANRSMRFSPPVAAAALSIARGHSRALGPPAHRHYPAAPPQCGSPAAASTPPTAATPSFCRSTPAVSMPCWVQKWTSRTSASRWPPPAARTPLPAARPHSSRTRPRQRSAWSSSPT